MRDVRKQPRQLLVDIALVGEHRRFGEDSALVDACAAEIFRNPRFQLFAVFLRHQRRAGSDLFHEVLDRVHAGEHIRLQLLPLRKPHAVEVVERGV